VHYTNSVAYATLAVHESLSDDAIQELIAEIDEQLVTSADPYREDFIVTVWRGQEIGTFADEPEFGEGEDGDAVAGAADLSG
jgi:hypothetical protein